jgi:hypothetical protein
MNVQRRKRLVSGVLWIVFSPLVLLMGLIAKTHTLTDYYAGVGVCGTWAVCGVISGFGRLAGRRWATLVQMTLCWITVAVYAVVGVVILFYARKGPSSIVTVGIGTLLTAIPFLFCARRRHRELREVHDPTA